MFSSLSLYFCLGNSGQIKRYRCAQVYFFSLTKSSSSPAILTGLLARVRNQMTSLGKESAVLNSKAQGFKLIEMSSQGYKVVYSGSLVFHREDNKGHLFFSVFFFDRDTNSNMSTGQSLLGNSPYTFHFNITHMFLKLYSSQEVREISDPAVD